MSYTKDVLDKAIISLEQDIVGMEKEVKESEQQVDSAISLRNLRKEKLKGARQRLADLYQSHHILFKLSGGESDAKL